MKKICFLILLLAGWGVTAAVAAEVTGFAEAAARYQAEDFESAAAGYQKMVDAGQATGSVYYNLGNSLFRAGQKAKALLAYERALRFLPRDRDLRWNIQILKSTFQDRSQKDPANPFLSWPRFAADYLSESEASGLLAIAVIFLFLVSLLSFLFPGAWGGRVLFLAFIFLIAAGVLFFLKWLEVKDPRAVVLPKEIAARYGPSVKETKAFVLHEGAQVKVLDRSKDWIYVVFDEKNSGWIPKESCEVV